MRRVLRFIGARLAEACAWQSAAMFAVKITEMVRLKQQWEEHQRLEAEYAELVAELEAAISPDIAAQVEKILTKHERRRTSLGGDLLAPMTPRKTKAPTEDATSGSSRRGLPALSTNLTEREYTSSVDDRQAVCCVMFESMAVGGVILRAAQLEEPLAHPAALLRVKFDASWRKSSP
jgi:hypothetical protein